MRGKPSRYPYIPTIRRIIPARAGQTTDGRTGPKSYSDHPRACGANSAVSDAVVPDFGSSPRVRGKPTIDGKAENSARIIPARAGQTNRPPRIILNSADHPRACGANYLDNPWDMFKIGSSPRVRGKPRRRSSSPPLRRITPARAGQTSTADTCTWEVSDHPRACGANMTPFRPFTVTEGSSPRVRGKPNHAASTGVGSRIIPARAGQTKAALQITTTTKDHPRACGANPASTPAMLTVSGSSPRVRGKPSGPAGQVSEGRIIPARAGQTRRIRRCASRLPDHPRACGANPVGFRTSVAGFGSSPRVRGKLQGDKQPFVTSRIIPARAGQTRPVSLVGLPAPDHPRACGANHGSHAAPPITYGSSPRVRGKRYTTLAAVAFPRIIPARAGQTKFITGGPDADTDHPRACGANVRRR